MNSSRPAQLDDPAALAALYADRPIAAVAEHLGVSAATVQRALARHGIPRRGRSETASARINNQLLADRGWLHDRYRSATITAIAAELGVATLTVRRALLIHGIALHRHKLLPRPERPSVLDDRSWLEARYQRAWSIREVADELGVNDQMVGAALRRHRIPIRSDRGAEHPGLTDPVRLATLVEEHGTDGAAAALGVTRVAVQAALRRHGSASPYRYEHRHLERPSQDALLDAWPERTRSRVSPVTSVCRTQQRRSGWRASGCM